MNSRAGLVAAVTAVVFWATGNVIVRRVDLSGLQIAFWRIALLAGIYWLILIATGRRLTWEHFKASAPAGIAISLEIGAFFVAIKSTTVANTTIIGALQPIVLLFFGIHRFGERVTARLVAVSLTALLGVALVVFGSAAQPTWSPRGDLLAFVAMLLFAAYYLFAKSARYRVPALEFQTAVWVAGAIVILPFAVFDAGGIVVPAARHWWGLLAMVAIPGTGHLLMNWAHPRVNLSVSSLLTLGIPVLSTIGAALFLDESIIGWQIPGIAVVIAALSYTIRREAKLRAVAAVTHEEELAPEGQA